MAKRESGRGICSRLLVFVLFVVLCDIFAALLVRPLRFMLSLLIRVCSSQCYCQGPFIAAMF